MFFVLILKKQWRFTIKSFSRNHKRSSIKQVWLHSDTNVWSIPAISGLVEWIDYFWRYSLTTVINASYMVLISSKTTDAISLDYTIWYGCSHRARLYSPLCFRDRGLIICCNKATGTVAITIEYGLQLTIPHEAEGRVQSHSSSTECDLLNRIPRSCVLAFKAQLVTNNNEYSRVGSPCHIASEITLIITTGMITRYNLSFIVDT